MPRWEYLLALVGLAAAFWNQTKAVIAWAKSWVVVTKKHDYNTGLLMLSYMEATMRRVPSRNAAYGSALTFVKPLERIYRVIFQSLHGGTQLFWRKRRPIWFGSDSVKIDEGSRIRREYTMSFSYLRGTLDWEKLLLQASDWEDNARQGLGKASTRFRVTYHYGSTFGMEFARMNNGSVQKDFNSSPATSDDDNWNGPTRGVRLLRWSLEDVQGFSLVSSIDNLSLRPELVKIVEELKFWHASQAWYQKHGVPWRRGVIFHGGPGTGKTSLARAIAESLDVPVHVFDLAGMSNQDLKRAWREMLTTAPCMALLEDIDAVFEGRKNVVPQGGMNGGGLTFDTLLNCIDGIERVDGMLVVVTTNKVEHLDDALVKRPGRIDRVIEFKPLDHEGRVKMATRILDDVELAVKLSLEGVDDSAAQFQERCFRIAQDRRFAET